MEAYLEMIAAGRVTLEPLITHRFRIDSALGAYDLLSGKRDEPYLGIVVTYSFQTQILPRMVASPPVKPKPSDSGTERISIGWIGAGSFSQTKLLPALRKTPGIELAGLANATGVSAARAMKRFGFSYCTTDPQEVLNDPGTGAVMIATRHHLHAPLVIAALQRGKHVFVEKPLCGDERELQEIAEAYVGGNRVLMVGFNRRFSPFAVECARFFAERREPLSILYRVNAGRLPADHWIHDPVKGKGRIVSEVCHFVDFVQFLTSSLPAEVHAQSLGAQDAMPEDNLHIQLRMADGSRAEILYLSSGDASVPKERIEIFGGQRTAICDDFRNAYFYNRGRCRSVRTWFQNKGHRGEMRAFVQAVRSGGVSPIPFRSLFVTTLATIRIRESLRAGSPLPISPSELAQLNVEQAAN